jgi:large subunit ribosomal protein L15
MRLNELSPALGSKQTKKRLGRGIGSGLGKTSGKGHKGQHARSGGYHKVGFEGGQMPLQRRLPKFGFNSRKALVTAEVRLGDLNRVEGTIIDLKALKMANIINRNIKYAKIFASGELKTAKTIKGIRVTQGVRTAIESLGGKIEE